jgi:hypothetical protein
VTPHEALVGIRDGNYHAGGFRCLQLLRLNEHCFAELRADVARLCHHEHPSDVRADDHVTNWTRPRGENLQFSLLNSSGRCEDFSDDHDLSCFGKRFHLGDEYPSLRRFIEAFPHAINFRVNVLGPGARLAPHEEHSIIRTRTGLISACVRFHLPIVTNPAAELILGGQVFHLVAGTIYFVNHGCIHSARNSGSQRRIHLVWDLLLTRESYDATFGGGLAWSIPTEDDDRASSPLRTERMGAYVRLLPPVDREEAEQLDLCEPQ